MTVHHLHVSEAAMGQAEDLLPHFCHKQVTKIAIVGKK
jgi:hypothetical protein